MTKLYSGEQRASLLIDWIEYGRRGPVARLKSSWRWQFSAMRGHKPVIFRGAGEYYQCHGNDPGLNQDEF